MEVKSEYKVEYRYWVKGLRKVFVPTKFNAYICWAKSANEAKRIVVKDFEDRFGHYNQEVSLTINGTRRLI